MSAGCRPTPCYIAVMSYDPFLDAPDPDPQGFDADPAHLEGLNPQQREAVLATEGPVLVLAGAGTGKTRVLTTRLAHLILEKRVYPSRILAVTFTNRAAGEMKERVARIVGEPVEGWWLGTFHALAARILRRHAELVGLTPTFTILDADDQQRLIKQLLEAENIDTKRTPARMVSGVIDRWKDRGLTPAEVASGDYGKDPLNRMCLGIYKAYQERLRTLNACDFGDLLLHNLALFRIQDTGPDGHPMFPILQQWQERFRYIMVDEYQDTNVSQYLWLRSLAAGHRNLCVVGDEDQSIYAWRGAEIANILRFEQDFEGATVVRLEENYRSTDHILGAASGLIAKNASRLGKTLFTRAEGGALVEINAVWDGEEEARAVVDEIEAVIAGRGDRDKVPPNEIAVLVRTSAQMRELEDRLLHVGVPYRVIGGPRFYERKEIRDALAYLRIIHQPSDDLAFERIYNLPKRGIGDKAMQAVRDARTDPETGELMPLTEGLRRAVLSDALPSRARNPLKALHLDLERWGRDSVALSHTALAERVLDESGYTAMWRQDKSPDAQGRLENLGELISAMAEFDTLAEFLEHVSLVMEVNDDQSRDKMVLMTLHGAKGLEFNTVFLPGWEDGLFPNQRALDESGIAGLEEERRLAYVGLTRARRRAVVSHAANRRLFGNWVSAVPSRFVEEIPAEHRVMENSMGMMDSHQPASPTRLWDASKTPARPPVTLEGVAYAVTPPPRPKQAYGEGERVFHRKFGYGTVKKVDNDKLTIRFDMADEEKKVLDSYVVPEKDAS